MKWGLGDSYDNVQFVSKKTRAYLDLTKPASSLGVAGAYFLGSIFYFAYRGRIEAIGDELFSIIFISLTMFLAHGASQAMNMAEDAEMDRNTPHKQNRPIPSGVISEEEARSIAWVLSAFALGRAFMVSAKFGALVMVLLGFGIFYNLEPVRAKERIISIPWQAASRGLLMFPAVWAAYGSIWEPTPWILGLFMFFYVLGFQNSADIIDRHVDAEYGISTFIVEFGVKNTVLIAFGCTMAMVSVIGSGVYFELIPMRMLAMLFIIPLCLYMLDEMWTNPHKVSEKTGNHPAWLWFYAGMVLCVAIPTTVELVIA